MTDSNASAATRARYDYEPSGERSLVGGDKSTPFGFTAHYTHEISGLALAMFRAYDSRLGRWLSEDPIGLMAGPNRYRYVENNPVNGVDPIGLFRIEDHVQYLTTDNPNMSGVCGQNAGGACMPNWWASITAECPCPGGNPRDVVLHYGGTLYTYTGDFQDLVTRPRDRTISTPLAAASHEHTAHIEPSLMAVAPLVSRFESTNFATKEECEAELVRVNKEVGRLFDEAMRRSQAREQRRGR